MQRLFAAVVVFLAVLPVHAGPRLDRGDPFVPRTLAPAACMDTDADGYFYEAGCGTPRDCNDGSPAFHAGAAEACDGLDNDCNGLVDDGCATSCAEPGRQGNVTITSRSLYELAHAWTGSEHGVVWSDNSSGQPQLYFARLDAAGGHVGEVQVTNRARCEFPSLAWTGSEYGLVWRDGDSPSKLFFTRLDPSGARLAGDIPLDVGEVGRNNEEPKLVWNGTGYGLSWTAVNHTAFVLLDRFGSPLSAWHVLDTPQTVESIHSTLVWTGSGYGVAWEDRHDSPDITREIYFARLDEQGNVAVGPVRVTHGHPASAQHVALVWNGTGFGMAWDDNRTDARVNYFTRLDTSGNELSPENPVCSSQVACESSALAWTGSEYGLIWTDAPDTFRTRFRRLDSLGAVVGSEIPVSLGPQGGVFYTSLTWTGSEYAAVWMGAINTNWHALFARIGCDCPDADGDGACGDCDDSNPAIYPGAPEVCNGIDDDCSGEADDDAAGVDSDGDGVRNACDNCPAIVNPDQSDLDADGLGDACDPCPLDPANDLDGDGVCGNVDNCPDSYNTDQGNADADAYGDVCDPCPLDPANDVDGDGVCGDVDNCPTTANSDQADSDGNGIGDACEPTGGTDSDGDGVPDAQDACPHSILDPTVVVPPVAPPPPPSTAQPVIPCDSGVSNTLLADGCTISDKIAACDASTTNQGQFDKCVKKLLDQLKKKHIITEAQRKAIDKCVKKYKKRDTRHHGQDDHHGGIGGHDH